MAQVSFGTILRSERERQGVDIPSVARRLRIRADIIRAIEESNFDQMPPRGYARNMVHAYARLLGLNPTEVTRLYLDEAYAFQVKNARTSASFKNPSYSQDLGMRKSAAAPAPEPATERKNYQPDSQRTLYVDDHASRYRYQDNPRGNYQGSGEQGTRTHRSTRSALPSTQYTNFYAGPKASSGILARLPVIIFAAILIAVIIFVIVFLLNNRPEGTTNNTPPNVVINDPGSSGTAVIKVPPRRVVFKFEVVDEALAWVNIYIDGNMVESDYATDITKRTYDVTGVLRFETPRPNAVRVYADGVELDLERDSEDGWMFSVTVSYPEALAKWHLENPPDPQPTGNTEGNN